jgi:hypothetical protein
MRKQIFKSGFKLKSDADDALRQKLNEKDAGELVKADPTTLAAFLQEWFREHAERNCTPKTVERYRQLAAYVVPHIGGTKIQDLSALTLERVFNRLKDAGGRHRRTKQPRPLSAKTVRHIAGLLHVALETAIRWKLLKANPVDGVQLPKVQKHEATALEVAQISTFLDAARAHGVYEFVMLAASTGCRRRERFRSRNHPSRCSVHTAFGPDYKDDLNVVFAELDGDYLKPDSMTSKVCLLASKAGLNGARRPAPSREQAPWAFQRVHHGHCLQPCAVDGRGRRGGRLGRSSSVQDFLSCSGCLHMFAR